MSRSLRADVVVIGGGVGGCAAALAAARMGRTVIMVEPTAWIGGQLTSQAVPPDEHPWIEMFGATRSYRLFRNMVREYYRAHYPLTHEARINPYLNPGNGHVSRLCHEPRVALAVLHAMLAPYVSSGRLRILTGLRPVHAETSGDRVQSVTVAPSAGTPLVKWAVEPSMVSPDGARGRGLETVTLYGSYFLDATETGELLPLAGVEYVIGAESRRETGEPHAVDGDPQPMNMQAITFCFALDYRPGEDHTIQRPERYDFWREYRPSFWPDRLLSWTTLNPQTLEPFPHTLFPGHGLDALWLFRRILDRSNFEPGTFDSDITLVNWPQNDYWLGPVIEVPDDVAVRHLEDARQLSLSLIYWLQTEAPRPDGGQGYPGLRLRADVVGETPDGLAMHPYIRESRRIRAERTVVEQDIGFAAREGRPPEPIDESVGVGCYRLDLHPSTGGDSYIDLSAWPFQIPLGALIPVRVENLLPAAKNIGVTHITNGSFRLHHVEWNIGEAVGALAAYCIDHRLTPRSVRNVRKHLDDFQALLVAQGFELAWPQLRPV